MSGRLRVMRALVETAAFPFVVFALLSFGLLVSIAHLLAMPALYLWENSQERKLTRRLRTLANKEVE